MSGSSLYDVFSKSPEVFCFPALNKSRSLSYTEPSLISPPPKLKSLSIAEMFLSDVNQSTDTEMGFESNETVLISPSFSSLWKISPPSRFSSPISQTQGCTDERNLKKTLHKNILLNNLPKTNSALKRKASLSLHEAQDIKRGYSVFSTSVTPRMSPSLNPIHIFRLSGVSWSPSSSITWNAQSPLVFNNNNNTRKSESFFPTTNDVAQKKLQEIPNFCPDNKMLFWKDDAQHLKTDDKLGSGGFGQVFEGTYRGEKVAVKHIKTAESKKQALNENFLGEVASLRLRHENLVRTLLILQSPSATGGKDSSYIVMERAGDKNLMQVIEDHNEEISENRRCMFCIDILQGLVYLHDKGLAHLDIKPSNIIVSPNDLCKICDFGCCKYIPMSENSDVTNCSSLSGVSGISDSRASSPGGSVTTSIASSKSLLSGTLIYRDPELLRGLEPTCQADMFSFAISAWQLWQREPPYPNQHQHVAVFQIVAFNKRPAMPSLYRLGSFDKSYTEIIQACWSAAAILRPSSRKVLREFKKLKISLL